MKANHFFKKLTKNKTLFIIGNGFDLHHGLHTSTLDFCEILSSKEIHGDVDDAYEVFNNYGIDWCEYEKSLSQLDLDEIEDQSLSMPNYMSDHEYDRADTIWYMNKHLRSLRLAIKECLDEMVESANEELYETKIRIKNVFKKGDSIISFNYTSTLEELYETKDIPILHIHGYFDHNESLLFGYKEGEHAKEYRKQYLDPLDDNHDYYVDTQRESIVGFYESLRKELQLKKIEDFLKDIEEIDQVCVMGHSMSDVDSEYMELIESIFKPRKWYISQYENNPSSEDISLYTFANKVRFYSFNILEV